MKAFVGVTDGDWYKLLSSQLGLEEINFWQPSGNTTFRALGRGELFLFKLHSPHNVIVGGGFFGYSTLLPVSLAWETFREGNGVRSLDEMRRRIERYRRRPANRFEDYTIGCIVLEQPFFFTEDSWIPSPGDWKPNIVRGATYDDGSSTGRRLLEQVQLALAQSSVMVRDPESAATIVAESQQRYGDSILVRPRLGQGAFRFLVTDAYERRCAISRERTLPVLEAAHIRPYAEGGEHRVDNGLLLRRDLHTLFDQGYITVTSDYRIEVSRRIREQFENGKDYYALHGRELHLPQEDADRPAPALLTWHNESVYRG